MGKQVRFYMFPQDEADFLEFVFKDSTIVARLPVFENPEESIIKNPGYLLDNPEIRVILYWNTTLGFKPEYFKRIQRKIFNEETGNFIELEEEYFKVDSFNAPVIEHNRSFARNDGHFVQGRIWAEMHRIENNEKYVYKGLEFEKWYDQIAKWVRKNFTRVKEVDAYVGSEALKWMDTTRMIDRNMARSSRNRNS
jgi:hypothetical protein